MRLAVLFFIAIFWICACTSDMIVPAQDLHDELTTLVESASQTGSVDHYILPSHTDLEAIPQDPKNALTHRKVALGQLLFFETGIGTKANKIEGMETYSCASCHIPEAGFRPGRIQGIADGGIGFGNNGDFREINPAYEESELDVQGIRPLTVLNVAFVSNTFWNGQFGANDVNEGTEDLWNEEDNTLVNALGFQGLEAQNIEGLGLHRMFIDEERANELGYTSLFDLSFPEYSKEERYSNLTASLAISAYLRTLTTSQAPFQNWLKGDRNALTEEQMRGAMVFFSKGNCYTCHTNPSFNSVRFVGLGVNELHQSGGIQTTGDEKKSLGRGGFTKLDQDLYKFKIPQLYNLKNAPFYFHGSSKETLEEVIDYFDQGIPENENVPSSQISPNFKPLNLTAQEKSDLKEFLAEGLFDPNTNRFVPPYIKSGNCFPNNDELSQQQLNCN